LELYYTNIISLPDNLHVEGRLGLTYTKLSSFPNNLYVGGELELNFTPISEQYPDSEKLRKMIEDKGGFVGKKISY
jgi:hypothetical protein